MVIKSNYRDFYDGVGQYDTDHETLLIRMMGKPIGMFEALNLPEVSVYSWWNTLDRVLPGLPHVDTSFLIGFAGKLYPGKIIRRLSKPNLIFWDAESYIKYQKLGQWDQKGVRDWFDMTRDDTLYTEKFGPIFVIQNDKELTITKNPVLKFWGMQHILPPAEAYNELLKWRYNSATGGRPVPEMSNETKIHQAGFDLKTSFRKGKDQ